MLNQPEVLHRQYEVLVSDVGRGLIQIPQFQREFVWSIQKSANLLDSIIKGYPIGTFIFWKTGERFRSVKKLGDKELPSPRKGEKTSYVLDGQQRLTSLFAVLKGSKICRGENKIDDFSQIFIDLNANLDEQIIFINKQEQVDREEFSYISLQKLLEFDIDEISAYPKDKREQLKEYLHRIKTYEFPIVEIRDVGIEKATEIFTRINISGKPLTLFDIMVAKTFDESMPFDLREKFDNFLIELEEVKYQELNSRIVLQISAFFAGNSDCKEGTILNINKDEFIANWSNVAKALKQSVDYFRHKLGIPVYKLLPYSVLMVPFSYFFLQQETEPTSEQQKYLNEFFWRASLGGRYLSAVDGKLAQDIKKMDNILAGKSPEYDYEWGLALTPEWIIDNGEFNVNRAFVKAILCLYTSFAPRSFSNHAIVNIDESWLSRRNSKNYHHFFPISYLINEGLTLYEANNIVNITIVDDYLNKGRIGKKPPSEYIAEFAKENQNIEKTMETHLITDLEKFGVFEDQYNTFLDERAKLICSELKSRIVPRDIDQSAKKQIDSEDVVNEED